MSLIQLIACNPNKNNNLTIFNVPTPREMNIYDWYELFRIRNILFEKKN